MDLNTVMSAISTVGFPIVCCGVLFYQNNKLSETLGELKDTLTENTTMLKIITSKMKGD